MLVSIIICTHQRERYDDLVEAIDSIKIQSYKNLEIVVVVDGNKELYQNLIENRIKVDKIKLNEENMGLSEKGSLVDLAVLISVNFLKEDSELIAVPAKEAELFLMSYLAWADWVIFSVRCLIREAV